MLNSRYLTSIALGGMLIGGITLGCDVQDEPFESRRAQQVGGPIQAPTPTIPDLPSDQCSGETEGSGEWCDCMGGAIDDLTPYYNECEDILGGDGPLEINLWVWCTQLWDDFDNWWDQC